MIEINDVTFTYKNSAEPALKNLSLSIREGEFAGIIGTSGAGKTTLTFLLNGIIPHELQGDFYGSVRVDGLDTVDNPPEAFCLTVGEVFQDIDSQMVASVVEDEILFGLENFGVPHDQIEQKLQKVLRELGIESLRTREIASLSGGQKQKVAIASILALEPRLIVLDEPTGELDPQSSREIYELLRKLNREKGITVVVVEQKIMLLCEYVNRLIVFHKGELVLDSLPRDVVSHTRLLKELGINLPRVCELAGRLTADGLYAGQTPLTVEEARVMVEEVLSRGRDGEI